VTSPMIEAAHTCRTNVSYQAMRQRCVMETIHIRLEIPDDRRIAEAWSLGSLIVDALPGYRGRFMNQIGKTMKLKSVGTGVSAGGHDEHQA